MTLSLLKKIKNAPILCVGDIMLDRYIYGQATRISPEAPVPVVRVKKSLLVPGGVGNVVKNLGALGALPLTVTLAGEDQDALTLSQLFCNDNLPAPHIIQDPSRPTSVKTRIIAGIQQVVRFDEEDQNPAQGETARKIIALIAEHMPSVKAVALSDYGKGVLTEEILQKIFSLASSLNLPVIIDPKGCDYSRYRGAYLVTPNRSELAEAYGAPLLEGTEDQEKAGRALMKRHGLKNLLITRSEDGMMLLQENSEKAVLLPSEARAVYDVSGAGDTVVAVISAALAIGAGLQDGAFLANVAAGVVVGKVGTASASPEEIEAYLNKKNC